MLVLGPPLSRHLLADAEDEPTLAALGMDRRQLTLLPLGRAAIVAVGGAVVSVAVALALSPLTPFGIARRAEIHPGLAVNVAVLAAGFAGSSSWCSGGGAVGLAGQPGERAPGEPSPVRPRLSPVWVAAPGPGGRRGGDGLRAPRGIGPRTAIVGWLSRGGVVAAITVGTSLRHLVDTPASRGGTGM